VWPAMEEEKRASNPLSHLSLIKERAYTPLSDASREVGHVFRVQETSHRE